MAKKILIIGACGQIGTELVMALREKYGNETVIASDIREGGLELMQSGPFVIADATNSQAIRDLVKEYKIGEVYLMAAMLSATAEKHPMRGWDLNMNSLFNILELGKEKLVNKIFWPSSIAVFGPTTPRQNTPQTTVMEPSTVYGISKLAGERWCEYYFNKYQVDVRSIRYPGLISYKTPPGGGTTDYAVEIFHGAVEHKKYTSFLNQDTVLPMMYMEDAIRATVSLMDAPAGNIKTRSSYNLSGISFSPKEIAAEIKRLLPEFEISYQPDFRQEIANSWPASIDDLEAQQDWNWKPKFDLREMTKVMLEGVKRGN